MSRTIANASATTSMRRRSAEKATTRRSGTRIFVFARADLSSHAAPDITSITTRAGVNGQNREIFSRGIRRLLLFTALYYSVLTCKPRANAPIYSPKYSRLISAIHLILHEFLQVSYRTLYPPIHESMSCNLFVLSFSHGMFARE